MQCELARIVNQVQTLGSLALLRSTQKFGVCFFILTLNFLLFVILHTNKQNNQQTKGGEKLLDECRKLIKMPSFKDQLDLKTTRQTCSLESS